MWSCSALRREAAGGWTATGDTARSRGLCGETGSRARVQLIGVIFKKLRIVITAGSLCSSVTAVQWKYYSMWFYHNRWFKTLSGATFISLVTWPKQYHILIMYTIFIPHLATLGQFYERNKDRKVNWEIAMVYMLYSNTTATSCRYLVELQQCQLWNVCSWKNTV